MLWLAAAALVALSPGAQAQSDDAAASLTEGPTVTYEQVLRDPDNIQLNFAWAQTQIRAGNLLGAASTLERILLLDPTNVRVRVLYAIVLYRLDNTAEAERELRRALQLSPPPEVREALNFYLARIERRKKRTRIDLTLNFTYQLDSNRNAAPGGSEVDAFLTRQRVAGSDDAIIDNALRGTARLTVDHDLGLNRPHRIMAGVLLYDSEQLRLEDLSLRAVQVDGGATLDFRPIEIRPVIYFRQTWLAADPVLSTFGGRVRVSYHVSRQLTLFALGQIEAQEYRSFRAFSRTNLRTGPEYRGAGGATYRIRSDLQVTGGVVVIRKYASAGFNEYVGTRVFVEPRYLIGHGYFLLGHFSYEHDAYEDADPLLSTRTRNDDLFRVRVLVGAPIKAILRNREVPDLIGETIVSVGGEYYRATSNITTFDYTNWRAIIGITRRFSIR